MAVVDVRSFILLSCVFIQLAHGKIPEKYKMEDNCGETITFSDSMLVQSDSIQVASCNFDIQAENIPNQLMIQVKIGLNDSCNVTSIEFEEKSGISISGKLCQSQGGKFKSTNNVMQANYQSKNPQTPGRTISILATSFHNSPCFSEEFQCSNGMCVSTSLTCNGYYECSDGSDEGIVCNSSNAIPGNIGLLLLVCFVCKLLKN